MFNFKTVIKGAAAGFILSFVAGVIGRVDFPILLLRVFLSAVFSGLLFSGAVFLYRAFLKNSEDEISAGSAKLSPSGSVVDITLADDELPDSDTAPDFAVSPDIKIAAASDREEVPSAKTSVPDTAGTQTDMTGMQASPVFSPVSLGGGEISRKEPVRESAALSGEPERTESSGADTREPVSADSDMPDISAVSAESDGFSGGTPADYSEYGGDAENSGESLDTLPDLEDFSAGGGFMNNGGDGSGISSVAADGTPPSSKSGTSADISDAKNIAAAIRTALKQES